MSEEQGCKRFPPITKSVSQRLYEMAESLEQEQAENERLNAKIDALQSHLDIAIDTLEIVKEHIQVFYSASLPEIEIIDKALQEIVGK